MTSLLWFDSVLVVILILVFAGWVSAQYYQVHQTPSDCIRFARNAHCKSLFVTLFT